MTPHSLGVVAPFICLINRYVKVLTWGWPKTVLWSFLTYLFNQRQFYCSGLRHNRTSEQPRSHWGCVLTLWLILSHSALHEWVHVLYDAFCHIMSCRYTCPFVEKFSIDIETYYKPDTGNQADVFNLSAADKRQTTIGENLVMMEKLNIYMLYFQ